MCKCGLGDLLISELLNIWTWLWQVFAVRSTLQFTWGWLILLAVWMNDRFCNDKLNYMYWCIPLSLITLDFALCLIFPSQSFRLEVGRPFSSLDIGVCCVGLSFFGLCDSVFLVCEEQVSLGGWVWIPLGDKGIYFTGEDECDSQISWGAVCLACVLQLLLRYTAPTAYQNHVYPLLRTFSTSLDA